MSEKEKLFKSVFDYIEINGFANFSLNELSKQKNFNKLKIEKYFISEYQMIDAFIKMINDKVYNEISDPNIDKTSTKDTLFEFIMIRFDKLSPYKKGLIKIYEQVRKNPRLLNLISKKIYNFIQTIFNLSGAKKNFILDKLSINSLFLIYLYVFNTWIKDNTSDMSKTMSDLDLCLSRAEMVMKKLINFINPKLI